MMTTTPSRPPLPTCSTRDRALREWRSAGSGWRSGEWCWQNRGQTGYRPRCPLHRRPATTHLSSVTSWPLRHAVLPTSRAGPRVPLPDRLVRPRALSALLLRLAKPGSTEVCTSASCKMSRGQICHVHPLAGFREANPLPSPASCSWDSSSCSSPLPNRRHRRRRRRRSCRRRSRHRPRRRRPSLLPHPRRRRLPGQSRRRRHRCLPTAGSSAGTTARSVRGSA